MQCQEYEKLERGFIEVRTAARNMGHMDPAMCEDADRQELQALFRLLDHRMEHRCQRTGE